MRCLFTIRTKARRARRSAQFFVHVNYEIWLVRWIFLSCAHFDKHGGMLVSASYILNKYFQLWTFFLHTFISIRCSIVLWSYPDNLNTSQALELLQNRLKLLGSTLVGNWVVDCEVLQSTAATGYFISNKIYRWESMFIIIIWDGMLAYMFAYGVPSFLIIWELAWGC